MENKTREIFEQHAMIHGLSLERSRTDKESYAKKPTQEAWEDWQNVHEFIYSVAFRIDQLLRAGYTIKVPILCNGHWTDWELVWKDSAVVVLSSDSFPGLCKKILANRM